MTVFRSAFIRDEFPKPNPPVEIPGRESDPEIFPKQQPSPEVPSRETSPEISPIEVPEIRPIETRYEISMRWSP